MGIADHPQQQIRVYHSDVCALVPLLQWLCLGRIPGLMSCIGIVLAFIGLILLAGPENNLLALGPGEIITLIGRLPLLRKLF